MPRRSLWLMTGMVAGAASSLYAERKLRRTVEAASARLQPDALVAEVGRTARHAAVSTGDRLREAMASGREEKRRRELELWAELQQDGRTTDPDDTSLRSPIHQRDAPDVVPEESDVTPVGGSDHTSSRRARRAARRFPSRLGK